MASSLCSRCLKLSIQSAPSTSPSTSAAQRAAFTTSSSLAANPPKKKVAIAKPAARSGRTLRLSRNTRSTTRPPALGERKALKKRVVLSNTNALEVHGLQDLTAQSLKSKVDDEGNVHTVLRQGVVYGIPNSTVDALRAVEAFKPTQGWNLFRRPATLVRRETVDLAGDLEWVAQGDQGNTARKILFGERGSGKSVLQLQALAMASLKNWLIVHIPEAKDLTNAHTAYEPISTPEGTIYIQPQYTAKLLENVAKANAAVLSDLKISKQHNLPIPLQPNTTLARLTEIGARDPDLAWPIWQALWSELLTPSADLDKSQKRPPILYCLDGADHIMRLSAYLNPDTEPIHAHELALVKHFVSLLSGEIPLPNGGMILAAVSESNRAAAHTLDHALKRNLAIQNNQEPPVWDPYTPHDKWVQEAMLSVGVQKLEGLSKTEARGVMEYYAKSGMLRNAVTDGLVSEKWSLSGGGIIGHIESGSVRARF